MEKLHLHCTQLAASAIFPRLQLDERRNETPEPALFECLPELRIRPCEDGWSLQDREKGPGESCITTTAEWVDGSLSPTSLNLLGGRPFREPQQLFVPLE